MPFLHCFSIGWRLIIFCRYSVPQNCAPIIRKSGEFFSSKTVERISRPVVLISFEYSRHADIEHTMVTIKSPPTRTCSFLLILCRGNLIMKMQIRNSTTRYDAVRAIAGAARGPFDHPFDINFIFLNFGILDLDNNLIIGILKISFCRKRSKNEVLQDWKEFWHFSDFLLGTNLNYCHCTEISLADR